MFNYSKAWFTRILPAAITTVMTLQPALAGPGALPSAPLFLSSIVEPNVFMTLDDSGSMDWELIVDDGTGGFSTEGGLIRVDGRLRAYFSPTFTRLYGTRHVLPPADGTDPAWDLGWIGRNSKGNKNYYDPTATYEPWAGTDAVGDPMYLDADPTVVLKDPNQPGGESMDLTQTYTFTQDGKTSNDMWVPTYFTWTDTNNNGVVDQTDAHTRVKIAAGSAEMKNFANWFQYYRSRINASKAIFGRTINNTDASRMGLTLFNNGLQAGIDTMSDPAVKRTLLNALYDIEIRAQGTPARRKLEDVGEYFRSTGGGAPIVSKDKGGECQQNFNLLMSDGFWNGWSPSIRNADKSGSGGYGNSIFDGNAAESNDGGNYADDFERTLADVAMYYYETDLRPLLDDKVPIQETIDEAPHQHLVNYTIAFGLKGTLDPTTADPLAAGFQWPEPSANDLTTVDDMWHAAYNSRGKFLSAGDPQALQASLTAAVNDISQRTGTAAAVAINSAQLSTDSTIYVAQFNSNRWQGDLLAFKIIDTNTGELSTAPEWSASELLTARDFDSKPRTIYTYSNRTGVNDGVPFQWASLSDDMLNDLRTNSLGTQDSDTVGAARLEYLRGDRVNEGTGLFLRERLTMLGDLVNSGPVFVGAPAINWPDFAPFPEDAAAYSEFKNGSAATRKKMVYAGANDGMLHAFDDDTGQEVFAYVPSILHSPAIGEGLHYLTDPNYVHKFYTDLTPTLSDAYITTGGSRSWHTVLVGGLRAGGRGIYALDVTNPSLFSGANAEDNAAQVVMWEFSSDDDPDLGYTYSRPAIALTNAGTWVAIFGNGYNDLGSGESSLFIVELEKTAGDAWTLGSNYRKITTGVGSAANRNGLATPALADVDGNGTVDLVYAGDLEGNLWVFDMQDTSAGQWDVAYQQGGNPEPLFTAPADQPITAKPVLAKHLTQPDSVFPSNAPNIMVFFGTGQYLVDADKTSTEVQSYYGVWDKGDSGLVAGDLIEQSFDSSFTAKVLTRNPVDYANDHGWYFDLEEVGERSVTASVARDDVVFFNSFVPVDDPCTVGGFGYKYAIDMITGGSPLNPVFDVNDDNVVDIDDKVNNGLIDSTVAGTRQEGFLPEPVVIEDLAYTGKTPTKVKPLKEIPEGRFSWQELIQ